MKKPPADNSAFNARTALLSLTSSSTDNFDENLDLCDLAENNLYTKIDKDFALNGGYIGAFDPSTSKTTKTGSVWGNPAGTQAFQN